jgi:hypothetical protein
VGRPCVVEPEQDDARLPALGERGDLTEVEVERQDHSILRNRLGEDLAVRPPLEALVAEVLGIVRLLAQPFHDAYIHAHVGQEAHLFG